MKLELETLNASPHVYVTAPTSPNGCSRSNSMEFYYSAPASPRRKVWNPTRKNDDQNLDFDEFEFETSKKFSGFLEFESSKKFEASGYCNQDDLDGERYRGRGDSLPSMAFADELFLNGLVMPLKLPPRLQYDSDTHSVSQRSFASTPTRSPRTTCKIPFTRQNMWDDDFDPFTLALEKVSEEKKGNGHRRSRSYSLFTISKSSLSTPRDRNKEDSLMSSQTQVPTQNFHLPMESKGSAYARWVRNQTQGVGISPKGPKSPRGLLFRGRVRPVQTEHEGANKHNSTPRKHNRENAGENKMQKIKGLLLRFASFGREKGKFKQTKRTSESWTPRKFGQSSFRVERNGRGFEKETTYIDANKADQSNKAMKPTLALCLGYGSESPRNNGT